MDDSGMVAYLSEPTATLTVTMTRYGWQALYEGMNKLRENEDLPAQITDAANQLFLALHDSPFRRP